MYKSSIKLYKEDSRRSRTVTPKKCTKKRNARHSELLSLNLRFLLVFFFSRCSCRLRCRACLSSLLFGPTRIFQMHFEN